MLNFSGLLLSFVDKIFSKGIVKRKREVKVKVKLSVFYFGPKSKVGINFIKEFLLIQKTEQNVIFLNKDERKQKSDCMTNEQV